MCSKGTGAERDSEGGRGMYDVLCLCRRAIAVVLHGWFTGMWLISVFHSATYIE